MLNTNQAIIIGGGTSINEGIDLGLWKKIENKFTVGLNYSFNYFNSTLQCFVDLDFYQREAEKLRRLPLVIGKHHKFKPGLPLDNTITLEAKASYNKDLTEGVYKSSLVGLFALSLTIKLLGKGEIYLLGYDYGALTKEKDKNNKAITHFYQGRIKHRGVGKINYYTARGRAQKDFAVYKQEKEVKIFNVSLDSYITTFPKISYGEFFRRLDKQKYHQTQLREEIKKELKHLNQNPKEGN
jgi:hypothetical protein